MHNAVPMSEITVLELPQTLPPGALLNRDAVHLAGVMAQTGGLWFTARQDALLPEGVGPDTALSGWRSTNGSATLHPSEPNTGNSLFSTHGPRPGLVMREGVHCGLGLAAATRISRCFSAGLIYSAPEGDPRTLLSLSTGQEHNLVFLSDADGRLALHARATGAGVDIPQPTREPGPRLVIFSYDGQELALHGAGRTARATADLPGLDRGGDLFVGCRSNRRGLLKTLGRSLIHDVFFWPDRAILTEATASDLPGLIARYQRWAI